MRRSLAFSTVVVLLIAAGLPIYFLIRASTPPRAESSTIASTTTALDHSTGFYLDIGASASLGTQPNGIPAHNGHRTKTGYSNDVVALERHHGMSLVMREIGCPGETVQRILGQLKDACYKLPTTQLSIATEYLRAHQGEIGVVTIDLGFNNIRPCLARTVTIETCVNAGVTAVRQYLPSIVNQLQHAAGPLVHFVGLEYSDPFLAYYLDGPSGRVIAQQGLVAMNSMNAALGAVYRASSVPIANVPGLFDSQSTRPATMAHVGVVPQNVARACAGSWMCTSPPFGPDDHPNNVGYMIIARAITATLPTTW